MSLKTRTFKTVVENIHTIEIPDASSSLNLCQMLSLAGLLPTFDIFLYSIFFFQLTKNISTVLLIV